jgi:type III secretory pathway lipoprotein EscJ
MKQKFIIYFNIVLLIFLLGCDSNIFVDTETQKRDQETLNLLYKAKENMEKIAIQQEGMNQNVEARLTLNEVDDMREKIKELESKGYKRTE